MKTEKSELLRLQKEQGQLIDRMQQLFHDIENLNDRFIALLESDLNVCPWCRPVDIGGYHAVALSQLEHAQHYMELAQEAMFIPEAERSSRFRVIEEANDYEKMCLFTRFRLNRCLKTKARLGGNKMVKIVNVLSEGKKRTPIQGAEKIKQSIADLDYRLESTGDMTAEIWNCLQDATAQLDKAIEWMRTLSAFE